MTYRWYGHVDWREDIDVGVNRSEEHLSSWRARDPLRRLILAMEDVGTSSIELMAAIEEEIAREISAAWDRAMSDPYPASTALLDHVYAE